MASNQPEIIWTKYQVTDTGCWEWTGSRFSSGYGQIKINGKNCKAHRIAYGLIKGDPGDLFVCHHCDNPPCINPDHLFLGTAQDNKDDCVAKNRHAKNNAKAQYGRRNGGRVMAKLSDNQVDEIRSRYTGKWGEQVRLSREYGVSTTTICTLLAGKRYAS